MNESERGDLSEVDEREEDDDSVVGAKDKFNNTM